MKISKIFAALVFFVATTSSFGLSRSEIHKLSIKKKTQFKYWEDSSEAKKILTDYVKNVTNKKSPDYIPVEDRIAVFDLDGTIIGERSPSYFEWMLYLERSLNDSSYKGTEEEIACAEKIKDTIYAGKPVAEFDDLQAKYQAYCFSGMTVPEFKNYVENFMDKKVEGLTNIKWGEHIYLPMIEVVSYLNENNFEVFIVSGSDRDLIRVYIDGVIPVKPCNVIGTIADLKVPDHNNSEYGDYVFDKDNDTLVRGELVMKVLKMNKVTLIAREIGKKPVLAFGNSSGDTSMLNYTVSKGKYKSLSFALSCDDLENDNGNIKVAEKMKSNCEKNGWISISMKDDWKTIFGFDVKVAKK